MRAQNWSWRLKNGQMALPVSFLVPGQWEKYRQQEWLPMKTALSGQCVPHLLICHLCIRSNQVGDWWKSKSGFSFLSHICRVFIKRPRIRKRDGDGACHLWRMTCPFSPSPASFINNKMVNSSNGPVEKLLTWYGQMDHSLSYQIWTPDGSIINHA